RNLRGAGAVYITEVDTVAGLTRSFANIVKAYRNRGINQAGFGTAAPRNVAFGPGDAVIRGNRHPLVAGGQGTGIVRQIHRSVSSNLNVTVDRTAALL